MHLFKSQNQRTITSNSGDVELQGKPDKDTIAFWQSELISAKRRRDDTLQFAKEMRRGLTRDEKCLIGVLNNSIRTYQRQLNSVGFSEISTDNKENDEWRFNVNTG